MIHGLHTLATTRLDQRGNLMRFAFPNQIGQGCRPDENLDREHPPLAIGPHEQLLGDDALELPIRPINFQLSVFQAARREQRLSLAIGGCPSVTLTRV